VLTIHVPKGGTPPDLARELTSARNIQDKKNRDQTITGLRNISRYI